MAAMKLSRGRLEKVWRSPWTRILGTVVGLLVVAHSINLGRTVSGLVSADPVWVVVGVAFTALTVFASVGEWGFLVRAGGHKLTWRALTSWYFQGLFVGQIFPAAIGGDAMRAVELGKVTGPGRALASLAGSRMAGTLGMAAWGLAGAFVLRGWLGSAGIIGAALFLVGMLIAWLAALNADTVVQRIGNSSLLHRVARMLAPFTGAFGDYRHKPRAIALSLLVGGAGWGLNLLAMEVFGRALGMQVNWLVFAVAIPISLVATLSPVTFNGIGIREGLLVALLTHVGVTAAKAAAFAIFVDFQMIPFAMLGGIVWMLHRRAHQDPALAPAPVALPVRR